MASPGNRSPAAARWINPCALPRLAAMLLGALMLTAVTHAHAAKPCRLTPSSASLTLSGSDQQVANLRIDWTASASPRGQTGKPAEAALIIRNASNLVLRNVHIRHAGGRGLLIENSRDIRITNLVIESTDAPPSGAHHSTERENIRVLNSPDLTMERVRLYRGSSGIYLLQSDRVTLRQVYGEDFRGPYPRGQFVQWDKSNAGLLEQFHTVSYPRSWPEDNINVYRSQNVLIRNGLIDGNNAPNGAGVIFDGGTASGQVMDVDTLRMGNGSFSAYDGTNDVRFIRTRSAHQICTDQGRGKPASGGTIWTAHPRLNAVEVIDSIYADSCFQVAWPRAAFSRLEVSHQPFTSHPSVKPSMCWESS